MVEDEMVTVSAKVLARLIEAAAWVVKDSVLESARGRCAFVVPEERIEELERALREPLEGEAVGDRLAPGLPPAYDVGTDGTVRYTDWATPVAQQVAQSVASFLDHGDTLLDRFGGLEIEE